MNRNLQTRKLLQRHKAERNQYKAVPTKSVQAYQVFLEGPPVDKSEDDVTRLGSFATIVSQTSLLCVDCTSYPTLPLESGILFVLRCSVNDVRVNTFIPCLSCHRQNILMPIEFNKALEAEGIQHSYSREHTVHKEPRQPGRVS